MLWVSLTPRECNSFLIGGRLFLREMRHSIEVFFPPCLILYSPLTPFNSSLLSISFQSSPSGSFLADDDKVSLECQPQSTRPQSSGHCCHWSKVFSRLKSTGPQPCGQCCPCLKQALAGLWRGFPAQGVPPPLQSPTEHRHMRTQVGHLSHVLAWSTAFSHLKLIERSFQYIKFALLCLVDRKRSLLKSLRHPPDSLYQIVIAGGSGRFRV